MELLECFVSMVERSASSRNVRAVAFASMAGGEGVARKAGAKTFAAFVSMAELSMCVRIAGAVAFASMADGGAAARVQIARSTGARYDSMVG